MATLTKNSRPFMLAAFLLLLTACGDSANVQIPQDSALEEQTKEDKNDSEKEYLDKIISGDGKSY